MRRPGDLPGIVRGGRKLRTHAGGKPIKPIREGDQRGRLIQGEDEGSTKFHLSRYSRKKEMEGSLRMAGFFLHSSTKCRSSFTFTASMAESYGDSERAREREWCRRRKVLGAGLLLFRRPWFYLQLFFIS